MAEPVLRQRQERDGAMCTAVVPSHWECELKGRGRGMSWSDLENKRGTGENRKKRLLLGKSFSEGEGKRTAFEKSEPRKKDALSLVVDNHD